ncbi:signal recognition particle-docking protein FtsY [Spirulina subsalsa]|uniref:signal recognition particle-docking protein FtsY n=1 Tax=Spirulina subsalsa TaxID=54311 RepID=UPI00031E6B9B|nr:signal recognition particle-docking protein FtsY [Spirulina subsalsa]
MFNWFNRKFGDSHGEPRQRNKQEQPPETPPTSEQPPVEEQAQESSESSDTTTSHEDYLQWAKAAYQNIQKRQAVTEEPPEAKEETPPEAEETVATELEELETESHEEELEPVAEAPEPLAETVLEEPVEAPEPVAEAVLEEPVEAPEPVAEAVLEEPVEAPEPVAETVPEEPVEAPEPVAETVPEEPVEAPEPVAETVLEEPVEEPELTPAAIVAEEDEELVTDAHEGEPEPPVTVPAWLKKSDALERLKATAIETPEPETVAPTAPEGDIPFDEDFMWSARVLAEQGRQPEDISAEEITWLKRLREGLGKTRRSLVNQLKAIVGQGPLNEDAVMEIEALLLQADVGVEATDYIIETLQNKLREEALPPEQAIAYLKKILCDILERPLADQQNELFVPEKDILNIWLMTGVNGAGKTTTIGKLAHLAQKSGYSCLIAAADTFRAAAVEQVKVWGERSNTPVIANPGKNTDPAAVVFDAITAAQSRRAELLLVDTAGRLQNKKNLMEELAKIRRIIDKKAPDAKIESLLVLDATLGQNGLRQAQVFSEAAQLSGVVLTKLDSSAKGGVALAVAQQLHLPIRFVGAGEGIEDLRPFSSYEFVEALLSD